ncbi:ATP synthase F1 subunit gamma [Candidatus Sumerlaeota bacterium]|nr:ATP synthase F1 subunit gamma [Candidatus Sumerlaeota bacterium]
MPESLKVLRRRLRSIRSTKQITRAMEMVSAAKLRRVQGMLLSARPYVRHLETLVGRLAEQEDAASSPYFARRDVKRTTLVLYTADRGLCGSYNANMIRQTEAFLRGSAEEKVELVCIGRRGHDYFRRRKERIANAFTDFGGKPDLEESVRVAEFLCERFLSGATDEVVLFYSAFVSTVVTKPTFQKFLPFDPASLSRTDKGKDAAERFYLYEPSRERVYERLIPAYLHSKIHISVAEALTSEHSSRMLAMNSASKNCDELVDSLTLRLNKARQGTITGDLLDIVGGAEALQQG